jgi:2-polyprenyl-6-methoxyphenol hydroxylase-like FAD-dependent oxidoreductase
MSGEYDVVIAGAGVGGGALALALAVTSGARVLVCDRRAGPGNINRGDSLLPAVTRHLRDWGALPLVQAAGARPVQRMQVFHHSAGRLFEAPLLVPAGAAPYLVLPHPEIERALIDAARRPGLRGRVEVRYRCKLTSLHEADGRVRRAVLQPEGGAEERVRARLVVGADGSSSTVRAALGITLPLTEYDHSFYITEIARPAGYMDAMRIELHPDGGVLVVPQGSERVGLGVLVYPREEALFRAGPLAQKMAAIGRRSPLLEGAVPFPRGAHLYKLYRGHAARYIARGAVLMGDSVHVTNPTAGQGMTMAIEDAEALARHLAPVLDHKKARAGQGADAQDDRALDDALRAYESERWPRNRAQIRWSHWLSRFYALGDRTGDALHRVVFGLGGSALGQAIQRAVWARVATR